MPTTRYQQHLFWGSLILLAVISVFGFSKNAGYLFPGGDGMLVLTKVGPLRSLSPFYFGFPANLVEGLGDMSPINYALEPSYNLGLLVFGAENTWTGEFQIFVNTVLSLEVFLATYIAALSFGFGRWSALAAAWLTPFLIFPYFGFSFFHPLLVFTPHTATILSENLLVMAAFAWLGRPLKSGRNPLWKDGILCVAIILMLAHMTIGSPPFAILFLPSLGVLGAGLLLSSSSRSEAGLKVLYGGGAFLVWLAMFGVYMYGQFAYTAVQYWPAELENDKAQWQWMSSWFRPLETAGMRVITMAIVGSLFALTDRRLRALGMSVMTLMAIVFGGGALIVHYDFWRGPGLVYIELFAAPVYVMFAVYAVGRFGVFLHGAALRNRPAAARPLQRLQTVGSAIAVGIIPAAAIAGSLQLTAEPRIYGPALPTRPPLVSMLADKVAISSGAAFRGRVATIILQNRREAAGWTDMIAANAPRADRIGNDFYWSGLWPFRIPTLFEYNPVMSPAFYRTAVDLWARPGDKQVRNVIVLRRADPTTMALFGVRFVISDAALPAPFRLETTEQTSKSETLYLYEVPDVNLGGYSPTEVTKAATFNDALDAVSAPGFDARRTAVVFDINDDQKRKLVPATGVEVRIDGSALVISASSAGSSLLILPFEFSRCLQVSSNSADVPTPTIFPVDGPLTGVAFTNRLDVRIQYFTSPFTRPTCRLKDAAEFRRLLRQ